MLTQQLFNEIVDRVLRKLFAGLISILFITTGIVWFV
jgi:hypothetical protein